MLFWIFIITLAIGIGLYIFACNNRCPWRHSVDDIIGGVGGLIIVLSTGVILISLIIMIITYIGLDGEVAELEKRYDQLVYELENDIYDNDNDVGKKELMGRIQEWNEDLAWYKTMQRDFWIGIFIPNIYDGFEFVELGG